jgi:sugar phosphate isomerase/epimerase
MAGIRIGTTVDNWRHNDKSLDFALEEAKRLGFKAVELCGTNGEELLCELGFMPYNNVREDPALVRAKLEKVGLPCSNVTAGFALMGPKAIGSLDFCQNAIRFAAAVGAGIVNTYEGHQGNPGASDRENVQEIIHNLRLLMPAAHRAGVTVTLEPHGPYSTRLKWLKQIVQGVADDHFGVNVDTGNTFIAGENPVDYVRDLYDHLKMMHIKDVSPALAAALRGEDTGISSSVAAVGGGVNADNIRECFKILKARGWSGTVIVEAEGTELVGKSLQWLKKVVKEG